MLTICLCSIQCVDNLVFLQLSVTPIAISFLLLRFDGITRFVIYRRAVFLWKDRGFPTFLITHVLVGEIRNTPPIWVHSRVGFWLSGILHLHTITTLLHRFAQTLCSCLHSFLTDPLSVSQNKEFIFIFGRSQTRALGEQMTWITIHLMQLFQTRIFNVTCGFLLSGILLGATFFI